LKVFAKAISVLAWYMENGNVYPLRLMIKDEKSGETQEMKVEKILDSREEKFAGHLMRTFTCQSKIANEEKIVELKYENETCSWILFKM